MPPSGFSNKHTNGIENLLSLCVEDLIAENKGIRTPLEAVQREIDHIDRDRKEKKRSAACGAVLDLVHDFYGRLKEVLVSARKSTDMDELGKISEQIIWNISQEILDIKVLESVS